MNNKKSRSGRPFYVMPIENFQGVSIMPRFGTETYRNHRNSINSIKDLKERNSKEARLEFVEFIETEKLVGETNEARNTRDSESFRERFNAALDKYNEHEIYIR